MKVVSFILSLVAICSSSFIKSHYSLNQGNGILNHIHIILIHIFQVFHIVMDMLMLIELPLRIKNRLFLL